MNDDAPLIKAALDRRFARLGTPACPDSAWHAATPTPAPLARPRSLSRGFAYAAALLVVAIGGLAAQAANSGKLHDVPFMGMFVSSKPLGSLNLIHRADRLTIAEAQRHISFPIVVPAGLPAGSQLLYAHVISEQPVPRVVLNYQAHIASKYYRIAINESTGAVAAPRAHIALRTGHGTKTWDFQMRRWKHGAVVMEMFAMGLPDGVSDRIVQANTVSM